MVTTAPARGLPSAPMTRPRIRAVVVAVPTLKGALSPCMLVACAWRVFVAKERVNLTVKVVWPLADVGGLTISMPGA